MATSKYYKTPTPGYGKNISSSSRNPLFVNTKLQIFDAETGMERGYDFFDLLGVDNLIMPYVHAISGTQTYAGHTVKSFIINGGYIGGSDSTAIPNPYKWVVSVSLDSTHVQAFNVNTWALDLAGHDYIYFTNDGDENPTVNSLYVEHGEHPLASLFTFKTVKFDFTDTGLQNDTKMNGCYAAPMDIVLNKQHAGCYDGTQMWVHGGYDSTGGVSDLLVVFPDVKNSPNDFTTINTGIYLAKHDMDVNTRAKQLWFCGGFEQDGTTVNTRIYIWDLVDQTYTTLKENDGTTDVTTPYPVLGPIARVRHDFTNFILSGGLHATDGTVVRLERTYVLTTDYTKVSSITDDTAIGTGALLSKCYKYDQNQNANDPYLSGYCYYGGGPVMYQNDATQLWEKGQLGYVVVYYYGNPYSENITPAKSLTFDYQNYTGRTFLYFETDQDDYVVMFIDNTASGSSDWGWVASNDNNDWWDAGIETWDWVNDVGQKAPTARIAIQLDYDYVIVPRCYTTVDSTTPGWTSWKNPVFYPQGLFTYTDFINKGTLSNIISKYDVMNGKLEQYEMGGIRRAYGQQIVYLTDKKFAVLGGTYLPGQVDVWNNGFTYLPNFDKTSIDIETNATPWLQAEIPNWQESVRLLPNSPSFEYVQDITTVDIISNGRWSQSEIIHSSYNNWGAHKALLMSFLPGDTQFEQVMFHLMPANTLNIEIQWQTSPYDMDHISFPNVSRPFMLDLRPYVGQLDFSSRWFVLIYSNKKEVYGNANYVYRFTYI